MGFLPWLPTPRPFISAQHRPHCYWRSCRCQLDWNRRCERVTACVLEPRADPQTLQFCDKLSGLEGCTLVRLVSRALGSTRGVLAELSLPTRNKWSDDEKPYRNGVFADVAWDSRIGGGQSVPLRHGRVHASRRTRPHSGRWSPHHCRGVRSILADPSAKSEIALR